jgi:8-amino-7-oxononanoate synthase
VHFGLVGAAASRRVVYMATLGKAAGVAGAFVAGDEAVIEWLLQRTRSYIFATAPPPMLACALSASLELIKKEDTRRERLSRNIDQLRRGLAPHLHATGWRLGDSATAIQPLVIGGNAQALHIMEGLRARRIWLPAIRPPTVPEGTARLRISLSATHTDSDVQRLVASLRELATVGGAVHSPEEI